MAQQSVGALLEELDRATSSLQVSRHRPLLRQAATAIRGLVYQLVEMQAQLQKFEEAERAMPFWGHPAPIEPSKPS